MRQEPKYSFIIPAYNAESTIEACVSSIGSQTYRDYEIIIIDDGSTDNTSMKLEMLALNNPLLHYKTIENSGPGGARNAGIPLASGEYIVFIDVDDYLTADFLEIYNDILENENHDLIISSYKTKVFDNDEVVSEQYTTYPTTNYASRQAFMDDLYSLMNSQMMYVVWNKLYRRDIIVKHGIEFPNYRSCEDRIFNLRYFEHVESAYVTEMINFEYSFDGKNSLTNRYLDNKFETFIHWYQVLRDLVAQDEEGYASLFLKGVMSCLMALHSETCPLSYKEKMSYIRKVVNHEDVKQASQISSDETTMKRVITLLLKSRVVMVNYYASKMIHLVSQLSPRIIEKFKSSY